MNVIVVSDTHGSVQHLSEILTRHPHAAAFHCGDFCYPLEQAPEFTYVHGNCDNEIGVPEERVIELGSLRILQTHGHTYGVKQNPMRLRYRATEVGANLVLFGHTHEVTAVYEEGILYVNPGSMLLPRSYFSPTYALLTIEEDGEDRRVIVSFYSPEGVEQSGLRRVFPLTRTVEE
ncbi:metallophosphoesterase family protein [Aneurinibacillus sp. REN35]|uniref:metallophosphoesterase family protein n=1 Tax=Aneurinibacillus sp. REN35 TaxID=3237286 RepID=UPI0035282020